MSPKEIANAEMSLPRLGIYEDEVEYEEGGKIAGKPSRLVQSLSEFDEIVDELGKTISALRAHLRHVTFSEPQAEKQPSNEQQSKPSSDTVRMVYELRAKVANHTQRIRQLQRELEV